MSEPAKDGAGKNPATMETNWQPKGLRAEACIGQNCADDKQGEKTRCDQHRVCELIKRMHQASPTRTPFHCGNAAGCGFKEMQNRENPRAQDQGDPFFVTPKHDAEE